MEEKEEKTEMLRKARRRGADDVTGISCASIITASFSAAAYLR